MRIVLFCHSLVSDWNHGNAHFLRGVIRDLQRRGHRVDVFEPQDGWSLANLRADMGEAALKPFENAYPDLSSHFYNPRTLDLDEVLEDADLVIVHEWTEPLLVHRLARHRRLRGRYRLLFHDTHHRSVTEPAAIGAAELADFDGVLAFGEVIRRIYLSRRWAKRAWTWHEAADVTLFRPSISPRRGDLVWIGNWGDGERTRELEEFLLGPARELRLAAMVYGVRYPEHALQRLAAAGIGYGGYLPNVDVPAILSRHRLTLHVPRRPYATALPGIPTIRVFEALACGVPLVSAPWSDVEGLFTPGKDFLLARDGSEMRQHLKTLLHEPDYAEEIARHGLSTLRARHTCRHRVDELLTICRELDLAVDGSDEDAACAAL